MSVCGVYYIWLIGGKISFAFFFLENFYAMLKFPTGKPGDQIKAKQIFNWLRRCQKHREETTRRLTYIFSVCVC